MIDMKPKLLAIDDDAIWLEQIPFIFEEGFDLSMAGSIDHGLAEINRTLFDIILLDLNFEGDSRSGMDLFRKIQTLDSAADVIVISGETRPERLIEILNSGITHFITKPASPDKIRSAVKEVLCRRDARLRSVNLAMNSSTEKDPIRLIGSSKLMQKLRSDIIEAVNHQAKDILILGETGTGKEVVARTIAQLADHAKRFVPINCGAISDGLAESELFGHVKGAFTGADRDRPSAFEVVGGGYIFLDEIGDMPLNQQAKLLRVLQERKVQNVGSIEERTVNFRCISATNIHLDEAIKDKIFREDLYYRIAKVKIQIPALRDRMEDIPELVYHFLGQNPTKRGVTITEGALGLLTAYNWPGNIRQLEAAVEIMSYKSSDGVIREKHVCQVIPEIGSLFVAKFNRPLLGKKGASFISNERKKFENALLQARGDRTKAAKILEISRATFFRRAKELGVIEGRRQPSTLIKRSKASEINTQEHYS